MNDYDYRYRPVGEAAWTEVEETGTDSEDYMGVPSSVTFEPLESVQTFLVRAVLDLNEEEAADKGIRLMFSELPPNVTTESPVYAAVTLTYPPVIPD